MRTLTSPSAGSTIVNPLKITDGGTGGTTSTTAAAALGAIASNQINVPNGVAGLKADGTIDTSLIGDDGAAVIGIIGATTVDALSVTAYKISNYDAFTTYTIVPVSGSVTLIKDTIYYTAPASTGTSGFSINGRNITINVQAAVPLTPVLAGSTSGAGSIVSATLTTSAYGVTSGSATHVSSDWQIATDPVFANIVASSMADTVNKTSWYYSGLALNTRYYARVLHRDSNGNTSVWSANLAIDTRVSYTPTSEYAKLIASDAATSDLFGAAVAISSDGTRIVVGAHGKATSTGSVYIYRKNGATWTQEAILLASDKVTNDHFGGFVAINSDGSRVVIGAYNKTGTYTVQGAAYVFLRTGTTWAQEAKLLASDPAVNDSFGNSVAINSDATRIIVGAIGKTGTAGATQGAAYVFLRTGTTWAQETKLLASDPVTLDSFGSSVNITSDASRVVIGAKGKLTSTGAAYIFTRTNTLWAQEAKIVATDGTTSSYFGNLFIGISSDGSRVVVGAYNKTGTYSTQGAAYIFTRTGTTWAQEAKLLAAAPAVNDSFGYSVSMNSDGTRVTIGCTGRNTYTGNVAIFTRNSVTWLQEALIAASDPVTNSDYGGATGQSSNSSYIVTGAYAASANAVATAGAVYVNS